MSDLHSKRQQFQERLNEITQRRKPLESNDSSLEADMLASIKTWEAHLDSLLAEFHAAKMQKPTSTVEFNRPNSRSDRTAVEWFQETDTMMLVELELGRHPLPAGFQGGYQLVESEDVMKAAIAQACGLAQAPTGLQWKDYHLGVFHIPGQGTLVNPSHYEGLTNGNPLAHAKVVSDVAMERWGWGFLLWCRSRLSHYHIALWLRFGPWGQRCRGWLSRSWQGLCQVLGRVEVLRFLRQVPFC